MINKDDVRVAYRLILGREPENEEVVSLLASRYSSLGELGQAFIGSREFLSSRNIGEGPRFVAGIPSRYGRNQQVYESRGGLSRHEDASGYLSTGVGGDLARFYFLTMSIDQLFKEHIPGDFAELGVYKGATASVLAIMARRSGRNVYLLDTFEGFSQRDLVGVDAAKNLEFGDTSIEGVRAVVGNDSVHFIKGYFPESAENIPNDTKFSLVHIDCDLYAPVKSGLEYFWPRLSPGGFMIIHDYSSFYWDGAEKAVDEFFSNKPEKVLLIPDVSGTAAVRKNGVPTI